MQRASNESTSLNNLQIPVSRAHTRNPFFTTPTSLQSCLRTDSHSAVQSVVITSNDNAVGSSRRLVIRGRATVLADVLSPRSRQHMKLPITRTQRARKHQFSRTHRRRAAEYDTTAVTDIAVPDPGLGWEAKAKGASISRSQLGV